ncbi:MbnP family protein [Formosa sp. S-31]|uniref:MbnP family protein n=1 Tax=Formosa sp. S-31 TaxID=2790949 RepID=UPI003EBAADB0
MKHIIALLSLVLALTSCSEDQDDNLIASNYAAVSLTFTHTWNGETVTNDDFNDIKFTNANGEELSISKLKYLISNVSFSNETGETLTFDAYNLVDVTNGTNLEFCISDSIPIGNYNNISFTFGFNDEDNIDGLYTDLNAASWNVPAMLGGGYHFMQLEGNFITPSKDEAITPEEISYQYHTIRAADTSVSPVVPEDTSIMVNLGSKTIRNNTSIQIKMDISEWFKNPNQWDLQELHSDLMSNYDAQIMMYQNGQNVFSLAD